MYIVRISLLSLGAHAQRELTVVFPCVCYLNIYVVHCCVWTESEFLATTSCFSDFDSWILLKMFRSKVMVKKLLFCCAGTLSPTTTEGPF